MSTIESIDLHVRTYRSALKSNLEVTVHSLTNSHLKMESILHQYGNYPNRLDVSAFVYSLLRLPKEVDKTKKIIMGQNPTVFADAGYPHVTKWVKIGSPARRRSRFFDKKTGTGAAFISSISDVDDIVNLTIAFQVEWNKLHVLFRQEYPTYETFKKSLGSEKFLKLINVTEVDWQNIRTALGINWRLRLKRIYLSTQNIRLQLLAGSWIDYTKTTQRWWKNIASTVAPSFHISHQQIYFVSSNNHSLLNTFTGYPLTIKDQILSCLQSDHPQLYSVYQQIINQEIFLSETDFLYYAFKKYSSEFSSHYQELQDKLKIISIPSAHFLDINTQIFPVSSLTKTIHDSRLKISKPSKIANSQALIFNIDYPLGFAAYHILNEILENVNRIKGVYVLGKAAVLNSEIGDIEIPRVVFDEHTQNSYLINNCFNSNFPFSNNQGSILTHQKAVSVLGTFLENQGLLNKYMENQITCVEMESGPYLSAITEATYDQQLPKNTVVDLNSAPMDIGIINYTSDTPYSKASNLGAGSLDLNGVEPVYLGSLAILQQIINLEEST